MTEDGGRRLLLGMLGVLTLESLLFLGIGACCNLRDKAYSTRIEAARQRYLESHCSWKNYSNTNTLPEYRKE